MMKKMCRLIAELALAIACAGMWGCSEDTFEWKGRSYPYLAALVDDSLALLYNVREYRECTEGVGPLGYSDCADGSDNYGLYLVNYREKKPVYWGDTIDYAVNFMRGFYRDSSVLFFKDNDKKFGFWKVGHKPSDVKKITWNARCEDVGEFSETRYRPWKNGDVLVINAKGCAYSVLDTATGSVDVLPLDGEYAWLKDCSDVTYLNGNAICLKPIYDSDRYGVHLKKNGELVDSLVWDGAKWSIESDKNIEILGNVFVLNHPTRMNNYKANDLSGKNLNLIEPLNVLTPAVKMDDYYSIFIDSAENKLQYTSDDLIITKGTK